MAKNFVIKKSPKKKEIIVESTDTIDISTIKTFVNNPRVGDVDLIAESIEATGQYKPILVNKRTMQVLAGNHTYLAMRKLGRTEILASFVDVDEDTATRIVLADNKTAQAGGFDEKILAELLSGLSDISGTGFSEDEVDELIKNLSDDADTSINKFHDDLNYEKELKKQKTFAGSPLGDEPDPADDEYEDELDNTPKTPDLESMPETMNGGLIQFSPPEEIHFEGIGYWGIPKLKPEMLMTFDEIPDNLDSWAGSATKDWEDEEQWWLYNWAVDSTSGMKDVSKVIVSFYVFDEYFDNWWYYPERYVPKLLNSGIKYAITPDWSLSTVLPKVDALWNLYRSRWVGRYMQEAGIKIIPNIQQIDGDMEWLEKYTLATLPKGLPLVAIQMQTIDWNKVVGGKKHYVAQLKKIFEVLEPKGVLIYAGNVGMELIKNENIIPKGVKVKIVPSRLIKLGEKAKNRQKKSTI